MENLIEENLDININSSLFSPLSMEEKKSEDVIRPSVGYWANAWRRLNENINKGKICSKSNDRFGS